MINNEAVKYPERNPASEALGKKLKPHLKHTAEKTQLGKAPGPNNAMTELIKAGGNYVASTL